METPVIYVWGGFRRERQRSTARLSARRSLSAHAALLSIAERPKSERNSPPYIDSSPTGLP